MKEKISVSINNKIMKVFEYSSLEEIILSEEISHNQVATAVNNVFIPKSERTKLILKNGDSIIIFSPITGG